MVEHARASIVANGNAAQIYFKAQLAQDSAFPLETGEDAVVYTTAVGVHIVPLRNIDAVATSSLNIDPPPREALPPETRPPVEHAAREGPDGDAETDAGADAESVEPEP